MVIIQAETYKKIYDMLSNYRGLSVECEERVVQAFPQIPESTIRSIISKHGQHTMRNMFGRLSSRAEGIIAE